MPDDKITAKLCHTLRTEIYQMIFPRWALMIAGGLIGLGLLGVYGLTTGAQKDAADASNGMKMLDQKFTMTIEFIKENQAKMAAQMEEQRVLLQKIDKRLDGKGR